MKRTFSSKDYNRLVKLINRSAFIEGLREHSGRDLGYHSDNVSGNINIEGIRVTDKKYLYSSCIKRQIDLLDDKRFEAVLNMCIQKIISCML